MIDGGDISGLSDSQLTTLASNIASIINDDQNQVADGWHLDVEPGLGVWPYTDHYDNLTALLIKLGTLTPKPISVAIGISPGGQTESIYNNLFQHSQFVVLMMYDYANDLSNEDCPIGSYGTAYDYFTKSLGNAQSFVRFVDMFGYGMIGVPAIATHHEFEWREDSTGHINASTSESMLDYLSMSLNTIAIAGAEFSHGYVGLSLWTFIDEPVGGFGGDCPYEYYPYEITQQEWIMLRGWGYTDPNSVVVGIENDSVSQGETSTFDIVLEGFRDSIAIVFSWGGSSATSPVSAPRNTESSCRMSLEIHRPDGSIYNSYTIAESLQKITIYEAEAGTWQYIVGTTCPGEEFFSTATSHPIVTTALGHKYTHS
jgi:hypothetical protein